MNPRITKGILLLISASLWVVVLLFHYLVNRSMSLFNGGLSPVPALTYQLVFAGFTLATALFIRQMFSGIERLDVITMLWRLFMIGMVGITLMLAMLVVNRLVLSQASQSTVFILSPFFFSGGLYALFIFFFSALFIFKRFVLYQKTRRKLWTWNVFIGFMLLALLLTVSEAVNPVVPVKSPLYRDIHIGLNVLYGLLLLVISTSVSWTAYLNFNQKLRALGLFALVIVVSVTYLAALGKLPEELQLDSNTQLYLQAFLNKKLLYYTAAFTLTYSGVAILVLFFNLPTSSVFELKSSEIASFNKINQAIQANLNFSDILNTLLDASMLSANAQAGWVEVIGDDGLPEVLIRKGMEVRELEVLQENLNHLESGWTSQPFLHIKNTRKHKAFRHSTTRFRSLVGLPVVARGKLYAVAFVANEISNSFEDVTLSSLNSFAEQAGVAIENARLIKSAIELERYREQLKIAKEVQKQLLPNKLPESDKVQFVAFNETAEEVGGDYFDIVEDGDHCYKVAIGDVSGKGTTAAFYMAEVKGIFHSLSQIDGDPARFITHANHAVSSCFQRGFFLTLTYLQIDLRERRLQMIRAGHCPAFYYHAAEDRIEILREGTLGLGIVRNDTFTRHLTCIDTRTFQPGDFLVLYTDGIIEARNGEKEEYGYDRMEAILKENKNADSNVLGESLVKSVKNFAERGLQDDYTVLIVKFL